MPNPEAIISLGRDLAELAAGEAKETGERLLMSSGAAAAEWVNIGADSVDFPWSVIWLRIAPPTDRQECHRRW